VTTPVAIIARKMASIAALHIRAGALERLSVTGSCHGRVGDEFILHYKATTASVWWPTQGCFSGDRLRRTTCRGRRCCIAFGIPFLCFGLILESHDKEPALYLAAAQRAS
jgi:hypothetical protein